MRQYLTLGSTPANVDCAQLGADDYSERMRAESRAYIGQLNRMFPEAKGRFKVKGFPHDYGTYHEIVIYHDETRADIALVSRIEANLPGEWDATAQLEMDLFNGPRSTYLGNVFTFGAVLASKSR